MTDKKKTSPNKLIAALWPEVFQTEESAKAHPAREAKRLAGTAPAAAMADVSQHATSALAKLEKLAAKRGHKPSVVGRALGQAFSIARSFSSDVLISTEKSYRGTLLGIHHGIGVFALLEDAAIASGDQELADFCNTWLAERRPLVHAAEEAMAWFAENPDVATHRAVLPTTEPVVAAH